MSSAVLSHRPRSFASIDALLAQLRLMPQHDPYAGVRARTEQHRQAHGCWAYSDDKGAWLFAISQAVRPRRVLELGTALGYTALSLAAGHPLTEVDTIEGELEHVKAASAEIERAGLSQRIRVLHGSFLDVLPTLTPEHDLAFFDGFAPERAMLVELLRLLPCSTVLVSANLNHGRGEDYVPAVFHPSAWETRFVDSSGETAISLGR